MTRAQIAGWTIWIGGFLGLIGYEYYEAHTPAAKAQQPSDMREGRRAVAQLVCAANIEGRDDGKAPAETVARAIIAKCGPIMTTPKEPPCSIDPKCMQAFQRLSLQAETESVLEERYKRAQARADDAKAALERVQPH